MLKFRAWWSLSLAHSKKSELCLKYSLEAAEHYLTQQRVVKHWDLARGPSRILRSNFINKSHSETYLALVWPHKDKY